MKLEALTPRDDLHGKEKSFKVYKDYLDKAFDNPKIRNLALSGSLGSGKSSIIRSYDRARNYGKKHFLYVSLMSFSNHVDGTATDDQKQLEYSLLNQIMSCCTAKDLPEGSINGIPEKFKWLRTCAVCLSMLCFSIYMLIFHAQFGKLAGMLFKELEGATFLGFEVSNLFSEGARSWVHLGLYVLIGVILCVCVYCILRRCLPFFQLSKLTVKANNAEAEVLMGKERSSLDVYKFELAYALEKMGKKYDYTVVFEDLERLDPNVAVDIMEKLRELNTLTNNHIQASKVNNIFKRIRWWAYAELKRKDDKYSRYFDELASRGLVRFVYAISDSTLSIEHRTKFYDCIIPIVPVSNPLNGRDQLKDVLIELQIDDSFHQKLLDALSKTILDYRTRLTLKNEFFILWNLYVSNNFPVPQAEDIEWIQKARVRWEANSDTICNKATMFAIAVYKVLLPQSYEDALSPNGIGQLPKFVSRNEDILINAYPDQNQRKKVFEAISSLQCSGLLDEFCLSVIVGEEQLVQHWLTILQNTLVKIKINIADIKLAEQVIPAVAKGFNKAPNMKLYEDFREKMVNHFHSLVSKDQETQFVVVARCLSAISSSQEADDWAWLCAEYTSSEHSRVFFYRCFDFLTKPSISVHFPNTFSPIFSQWCIKNLKLCYENDQCYLTDWNSAMGKTLVKYLKDGSPNFIGQHPTLAELMIDSYSLGNLFDAISK